MTAAFAHPAVAWRGTSDQDQPLVVLLHGRGSDENDIISLATTFMLGLNTRPFERL